MAVSEDEEVIPDVIVAVMLVGDVIALTLIFLILMMAMHLVIKRKRPNWCYPKVPKTLPKVTKPELKEVPSTKSVSIREPFEEEVIYEEPEEVLSCIANNFVEIEQEEEIFV